MITLRPLLLVPVALVAAAAAAHDYQAGSIRIEHPVAYETAPTAQTGAGYMTLVNEGETADRLVAVRAEFPRVEVHESVEAGGVASMRRVEALELPAGEAVTLAPGGLHVMFVGLGGDPFEAGEEIQATLVFEAAGEVEVVFQVEPRPAAEAGNPHAGH